MAETSSPASPSDPGADSFPRRQARTRRFALGSPRDLRVSADGNRVAFLRSSGPEDPANALWVLDVETGEERLVVDPTTVGTDDAALPPEERARRERARESGEGIVAYDADPGLCSAAFALGGRVVRVDIDSGAIELLESAAGAFDPRLSPDGGRVAYVSGPELRVVDSAGDHLVVGPASTESTVTWGSAEFVAGEEMGRTRGFWWSPDGDALLVERVDVEPVATWWIASPVSPEVAPTEIRYPAAGTANARVSLALVDLDDTSVGERREIRWTGDGEWEYLADVEWTADALLLTVQSRDQRSLAVLDVNLATGTTTERQRITDDHWVELGDGVPTLAAGRLVTIEDRGTARRLCLDGDAVTGDDVQVRRVVATDDEGVVIAASLDPTTVSIGRVDWSGTVEWWTPHDGVHGAAVGGSTRVILRRSLDADGAEVTVTSGSVDGRPIPIENHAADPGLDLDLSLHRFGPRELATAVLLPRGADHDTPLPVLVDPYGGPHAQRVQRARSLFHTSQWFADQGFAVVVTDGRGTPARGPEFERAVRGDLATAALEDQIVALEAAAAADPRLDLGRVAIRGWSFGGYLAALAVLRRPDVFHAAIAGAPVTDWRLYDTHYTERYLGHPETEPDNYENSSLDAEAAALTRPLMLIHGLADDNVVAAHTLRFSRALVEAGRAHTVLPLSGVTHMTPQEAVAENLLLLQLAFLRESLPG